MRGRGFSGFTPEKHLTTSIKGGRNNVNRHKFSSEQAKAAAMKRWNKHDNDIHDRSKDVVQQ